MGYLFGRHPVEAALEHTPGRVQKIFLKESVDASFSEEIKRLAGMHHVPFSFVDEKKLETLVPGETHQGVVALVSDVALLDFKAWLSGVDVSKNPCVVLLDELEDPHNVGAIIRSAAAFGVSAILIPKHRQSPITPTVEKASSGTISLVPIVRIGNVNDAISKLKEKNFWIVGLDGSGDTALTTIDWQAPTAIVIGGEGKGVREHTRKACDFLVKIQINENVESLNASVAAAIVMYMQSMKK